MARTRPVALFLSMVLIGTASPSSAAPSRGDEVRGLRGVNRFTATTTSTALVRFPGRVDVSDVSVVHKGAGRIRGFILRKVGAFEQEGLRPVMHDVNIGRCLKKGCRAQEGHPLVTCFCSEPLSGVWELYVIADGAPVTVTLRIKGEKGSTRTRVTHPASSEFRTFRPRFQQQDGNNVYSSGGFTKLEHADFGVHGIWVDGDPYVASAIDDCLYRKDDVNPPGGLAFTPGCPTGGADPYVHSSTELSRGSVLLTTISHCCPIGMGGWYTTASTVTRHGAVALWIDF